MKFWLIQRATTKTDKPYQIEGIDSFLSFDYMGSAEFEFNALPKALKSAVTSLSNLTISESGVKRHDGKRLFIIAIPENHAVVAEFLKSQAEEEHIGLKERTNIADAVITLKERTNIADAVKGGKYTRTDCWWDIENNWFAIFGKPQAENLLLAIRKVKEKKGW